MTISDQDDLTANLKLAALKFISYDDADLPVLIHQLAMVVSKDDEHRIRAFIDHLFIDKVSGDYLLPTIHLN